MTDYLDAEAVLQIAESMPEQFLECRVGRHFPKPQNSVVNKHYGYRENTYRCACGLIKHEIALLTFPFRVIDSWPEYPEGYLLHGVGRIVGDGRDVLKGVRMERAFGKPKAMPAAEARRTPPPRGKAKRELGYDQATDANVVPIRASRKAG